MTDGSFQLTLSDGALAGRRFGAPGARPLLFCHATGFCAAAYGRVFAAMGDCVDGFALDLRGHGRSTALADPAALRSWETYAEDIRAALDAIAEKFGVRGPWTLAGHSMGGVSSLLASRDRLDVTALRLIDPPLGALPLWLMKSPIWPFMAARLPIVRGAKARRDHWPTRADVQESYGRKRFFSAWAPGVLEDYLVDGLREGPEGVRLACAPAWEAATFTAQRHDIWPAVRALVGRGGDLKIWAARQTDSPFSATVRTRLRRAGAQVLEDHEAGHLWPMEHPAAAAAFLSAPPETAGGATAMRATAEI